MKPKKRIWSPSGFHADKVYVRTQVPWYWRGIALALVAAMVAAITGWFFDRGQKSPGVNRQASEQLVTNANDNIQRLTADNAQIKSGMDAMQPQAQIDLAAQKELSRNVTQLQEENAHLKEEVTFLRSIMSSGKVPEGLSVQNFRIEPDALPDEYRFNVLLVQGGLREKDFLGKAQLMLNLQKDGTNTVLTLPGDEKAAPLFAVNLKYYQRLEGRFKVPPGTVIKSAQLRVTEKTTGQVRLTRSLTIS